MAITTIPLGNKPFVTPYTSVGREVCKNLYLEYSGSATAKAEYYAIRIPGMNIASEWYAGESRVRAVHTGTDGNLYIIQRNRFARIDAEGHGHQLGAINTISTAPVSICDNGSELFITDGQDGWIYSFALGTFERVTDTAFPGVVSGIGSKHCACIDGYFFVLDPGTTKYQWSQPFYIGSGGEFWNGLDFGQKQATPEPILTIASCQGLLWLFGSRSIEVHYNTGDFSNGLWQRQQGAIMQMGCAAEWSVAVFASNVFWLGADGTGAVGVWTNDGFQPRRISTRGIEQIFQTLGDLSGTVGFVYSHNGHTFYVLQLPGRCFVYDATTDAWHERTYLSPITGEESAWRGWLHAYAYGKNIVGQIDGGGLCWIDQNAHRNRDPLNFTYDKIRWEKTSPITFAQGKLVSYWSAQPIFQQGVGLLDNLPDGTGKNPVCRLSWANDSGVAYGNEHELEMGAMGEYGKRTRKMVCGHGRNRVWKLTGSDPVPTILVSLLVDAEVMGS